jgi:hypothetical protein
MSRYRHLPPSVGPMPSPEHIARLVSLHFVMPLADLRIAADALQRTAHTVAADSPFPGDRREFVRTTLLTARILRTRARRANRILRRVHA